jgi:hypothetical protein
MYVCVIAASMVVIVTFYAGKGRDHELWYRDALLCPDWLALAATYKPYITKLEP